MVRGFRSRPVPRTRGDDPEVLSKFTTELEMRLRDVVRCVWHKAGYKAGQGVGRPQLLVLFHSEHERLESQFRGYLLRQDVNGWRDA